MFIKLLILHWVSEDLLWKTITSKTNEFKHTGWHFNNMSSKIWDKVNINIMEKQLNFSQRFSAEKKVTIPHAYSCRFDDMHCVVWSMYRPLFIYSLGSSEATWSVPPIFCLLSQFSIPNWLYSPRHGKLSLHQHLRRLLSTRRLSASSAGSQPTFPSNCPSSLQIYSLLWIEVLSYFSFSGVSASQDLPKWMQSFSAHFALLSSLAMILCPVFIYLNFFQFSLLDTDPANLTDFMGQENISVFCPLRRIVET